MQERGELLRARAERWEPVARARARLLELKSDEVYFPHIIRLMGLQFSVQDPAAVAARAAAARFY